MSINLRHKEILNILEKNGAVSIRDLVSMLYVSEATVRRDLTTLEKAGSIKRTFGGAKPITDTKNQIPLSIRESLDSRAKSEICKKASLLIKEGDTIFLDGSSTAQYLVKYISNIKDIVVVTYSIKTAELMCENHIKTYCAGGLMLENSLVCVGNKTVEFANTINTDICFISCKGVDRDGKFTDTSEEETVIRKAFMKNCSFRVMLMTQNKFNSKYLHTLCEASEIDCLISDGDIPTTLIERFRKKGDQTNEQDL
ncbi:MAG: DeoR/GlpR transcriptional regulator [Clostridia bacterium]|nr:DeoR/GlpR transcriptional regulator [Clostridia bacterium]